MEVVMVDIDALVPSDHLLRKVKKVMDYDFLYERLSPLYCTENGRPGTDPVVLVKMVLAIPFSSICFATTILYFELDF